MNTPDNGFDVCDSDSPIGQQVSNEDNVCARMLKDERAGPVGHGDAEWHANFGREQVLLDQLAAARQQFDDNLTSLAEKERNFSRQMIKSAKEFAVDQRQQAADREAASVAEIMRASESLNTHASALSATQQTLAEHLDETRALGKEQLNAGKSLIAATRDALESRLTLLDKSTSAQAERTNVVHERLDAYLSRLESREREFAERLESVNHEWQRRIDDDRVISLERTRANVVMIEQAHKRIELAFSKLVAREVELAALLHELERASEHHQQNREQYFALQLEDKQRAIDALQTHLTVTEQRHQAAYAHLASEVTAACSALPWRWMRPLRALQANRFAGRSKTKRGQ